MTKSSTAISKNVMDRIASGTIRMRPRLYYVIIGGLSIGASVLATIASAYGMSIVFFWARIATADTMAYGARARLSQLAESFPWWAFIGAAALVVGAAYVVRRYGHLYRHKVSTVLLTIVACSLVAGLAMSYMNIGKLHGQNYPGAAHRSQSGWQHR